MNKSEAKRISESVKQEDLVQMFNLAQEKIIDWRQPSRVNAIMDKGSAFNILSKGMKADGTTHPLAKINMIWEFGEYLPNYCKPVKNKRKTYGFEEMHHEEPVFLKE